MPTRSLDKDPLNQGLLLSLPMFEGTGTATVRDVARPHHPVGMTHSPAWGTLASGQTYLDLDGANDYLQCAAASCTDLDFTTGDFSGCVWATQTTNNGYQHLMCRGTLATDGWLFRYYAHATAGYIQFCSSQAGASQNSRYTGALTNGAWVCCGFSRSGASVRIYMNGADATTVAGSHVNPATSARKLLLGIYDDEATLALDGSMWNPRIWNRALSPSEHMGIFKRERHLLGV